MVRGPPVILLFWALSLLGEELIPFLVLPAPWTVPAHQHYGLSSFVNLVDEKHCLMLVLKCIIFGYSYFYFVNDLGLYLSTVASDFLRSL